jgi:hypothetical protein
VDKIEQCKLVGSARIDAMVAGFLVEDDGALEPGRGDGDQPVAFGGTCETWNGADQRVGRNRASQLRD